MRNVGALILAAGGSTRFGEPKQFLRFERETLLRRAAKAAHEADCAPIVVVAGESADRVSAELHNWLCTFSRTRSGAAESAPRSNADSRTYEMMSPQS